LPAGEKNRLLRENNAENVIIKSQSLLSFHQSGGGRRVDEEEEKEKKICYRYYYYRYYASGDPPSSSFRGQCGVGVYDSAFHHDLNLLLLAGFYVSLR
jgi:hypothetical protein